MRNPWGTWNPAYESAPENHRDMLQFIFRQVVDQVPFPADKEALMERARSLNVPESVIETVRRLPDRRYQDAEEVAREAGMEE